MLQYNMWAVIIVTKITKTVFTAYKISVDFKCQCQFLLQNASAVFAIAFRVIKVQLIWKWTQQGTSPPLWWSYGSFLCPLACVRVCTHARGGARARSHVGLVCTGCMVAFLVVCWSYCNSVVVVCLFADKSWPLLYSTVRLYSFLNCELINSSNYWNESSFACIPESCHVCGLMALTGKSLMFWFTEMLHAKKLQAHSSTSEVCAWCIVDGRPVHRSGLFLSQPGEQMLL